MKTERVSLLIGIALTLIFVFVGNQSLKYRKTIDTLRTSGFSSNMESLSQRYNDFKYKLRQARSSQAPVALIAVDDESVHEIGRWPWSRETMAELTRRLVDLGAKSVAFDAIFSEPERNTDGDKIYGKVVADHPDRIILGTFSEELINDNPDQKTSGDPLNRRQPYQDVCVAEAFLASGGDQIVKINPTFVFEDLSTKPIEELDWPPLFQKLFPAVQKMAEKEYLKSLGKTDLAKLTIYQKNALDSVRTHSLFEYCSTWLTPNDMFMAPGNIEQVRPVYAAILAGSKTFKDMKIEEVARLMRSEIKTHPVPNYGFWTPNIPDLQNPSMYTASFLTHLDDDGFVRRYPLFYRSGNKMGSSFLPSLALQSYLLGKGYRADIKVEYDPSVGSKTMQSATIVDPSTTPEKVIAKLPVDSMGQMLVNFYGGQMSLPYVSARDILDDRPTLRVQTRDISSTSGTINIKVDEFDKKTFLKDRSLIFGATAIGIYDLRNIPVEKNFPGPEIHLSMLANLMDGDFIHSPAYEDTWMPYLAATLGLLLSVAWAYFGPLISLGLMIVVLGTTFAIDLLLFFELHILTSLIFLLAEILGIYFAITIYKYFTEEKHKRAVKQTFSKYVSPAVVDELLKDADKLKLGGRKQRMSVFFSDVRGFTTISEKLSPEDLSKLLNRYLSPMTEIVFANKGTLDKYMGDAIMAFFGAPVAYDNHAEHACRCALKSLVRLTELQKELAAEGLPSIDIGIGINTGEMSVGNMGSNIVQNYTVMGDSVNLASRLEGINKEYGTRIIISEFTYADVKDKFCAREVDRVRVKGKLEPVRIFEVVAEGPAPAERAECLKLFGEGYDLYMQKQFQKALEVFQKALASYAGDPVSELYVERCQDYIAEAPPENWDGVYVMKTK